MAGWAGVFLVIFVACICTLFWAPMEAQTAESLRVMAVFFLILFLVFAVIIYAKNARRLF